MMARSQKTSPAASSKSPKNLMGQAVFTSAVNTAGHNLGIGCTHHQAAGQQQQLLTRFALQFAPKFISAEQQGNIGRMLKVSLSDDPRASMTGAKIVRWRKLLKAQHLFAARCEMTDRGTAHAAQPEHDYVVGSHAMECCYLPSASVAVGFTPPSGCPSTPGGGCSLANSSLSFNSFRSRASSLFSFARVPSWAGSS
jgi:hypothetical protein